MWFWEVFGFKKRGKVDGRIEHRDYWYSEFERIAESKRSVVEASERAWQKQNVPDYYLLPNGIQAKEVARHLTSNAGQAVQYIARSCRIDGVTKGEPIRDLEKARDMINDEINRLKEKE